MSRTFKWFLVIAIGSSFFTECGTRVARRRKRPRFRNSVIFPSARFSADKIDPDKPMAELPKELTYVNYTVELCKICKDCKSCQGDSEFRAPVFPSDHLVFTSVKGKHSEQAVRDYISRTFPQDLKELKLLPYRASMNDCLISVSIMDDGIETCECNEEISSGFSLELHGMDKIFDNVNFCCDWDEACDVYVNTRANSPLTYTSLDEDYPTAITYTRGVESKIKLRYKTVDSSSGKETFYAVDKKSLLEHVRAHSKMLQDLDFDLIMATDILADWLADKVQYCYSYGVTRSGHDGFKDYIEWLRSIDWSR